MSKLIQPFGTFGGGGGGGYTAQAVHDDGTAYNHLGTNLSLVTDNFRFACSFWLNNLQVATDRNIFTAQGNSDVPFQISILPAQSKLQVIMSDTVSKFFAFTTDAVADFVGGGWINVLLNGATNAGAGAKTGVCYVGDTAINVTKTDASSAFNVPWQSAINFECFLPGPDKPTCDLAEFWMEIGINAAALDFTQQTDRRKFHSAGLKPISLGSDGSTPTGIQPVMYFKGNSSGFETNRGFGGSFSRGGNAFTDASTSPSD